MGGNEVETASIDNFKSFKVYSPDKGSKEMDIGWDMRLREDFPQMNETTVCVNEVDPVERCAKSLVPCLTLWDTMDCSLPGSSVHGDSPGKNTGVARHFLLQGIFLTQGSNPGLLVAGKFFIVRVTREAPYWERTLRNLFLASSGLYIMLLFP